MGQAREIFLENVEHPQKDDFVGELRLSLSQAKRETLDQVEGLDEAGMRLVMPGLYAQIVSTTIQIATHVGLAVGLALEAYDEQLSGVSVSTFSREVRQQMTETGVAMKRRHSSRIAKLVAEVEAQRLAWRHAHEFLSWLAFRRGDARYPAADRRERMEAFKVQPRILQSREAVTEVLGGPMTAALEGHDRFLLGNRWKLEATDEHAVEAYAYPILTFQAAELVRMETARNEHDALVSREAPNFELEASGKKVAALLRDQLAAALDTVPESGLGRVMA